MNNLQKNQRNLILLLILAIPAVYLAVFLIQQIIWILGTICLFLILGYFLLNFKKR